MHIIRKFFALHFFTIMVAQFSHELARAENNSSHIETNAQASSNITATEYTTSKSTLKPSLFVDSEISLVTITGKSYDKAVIKEIGIDYIKLMHSSGIAKIPKRDIPDDIINMLGPCTTKAVVQNTQTIAVSADQSELIKQQATNLNITQPTQQQEQVLITSSGYKFFLNDLISRSGQMTSHANAAKGYMYATGPLKGKTQGEGEVYARGLWDKMNYNEQLEWQTKANFYSKGRSQKVSAEITAPTAAGFNFYYKDLVDRSGQMAGHEGNAKGAVYSTGPLKGKTRGGAQVYAREQWEKLSIDEQLDWEEDARTYGR